MKRFRPIFSTARSLPVYVATLAALSLSSVALFHLRSYQLLSPESAENTAALFPLGASDYSSDYTAEGVNKTERRATLTNLTAGAGFSKRPERRMRQNKSQEEEPLTISTGSPSAVSTQYSSTSIASDQTMQKGVLPSRQQEATPKQKINLHESNSNIQTSTLADSNGLNVFAPEKCPEPHCMNFLSSAEKAAVIQCGKLASTTVPGYRAPNISCRFLRGARRTPVALNSQEGSGNTWVRELLERATGICTGFNWGCDPVLRAHGFLGEGVRSGKVLVVKTHVRKAKWKDKKWTGEILNYEPYYGSGVLILRHPALAMIADYNRQIAGKNPSTNTKSHTYSISKDHFGERMLAGYNYNDEC